MNSECLLLMQLHLPVSPPLDPESVSSPTTNRSIVYMSRSYASLAFVCCEAVGEATRAMRSSRAFQK